jgi:hypothetical protein
MKGYVARKGHRWYAVIYDGLDPVTCPGQKSPVRADAARSGAPLMLVDASRAPRGWCGGVPTGHRLT